MSDRELLEALRKDDEAAFNCLYERYWEQVYRDAFYALRSTSKAKDITQEIFVKLWSRRKKQEIENLKGYLKVCVRNRVLNLFEKERRYVPIEELLLNLTHGKMENTDALARRNEFLKAYEALVNTLPEKRRKIFRFHFEENLSTDEIAEKLSISRKTVQNQLGRAVASIKLGLTQLWITLCILMMLL